MEHAVSLPASRNTCQQGMLRQQIKRDIYVITAAIPAKMKPPFLIDRCRFLWDLHRLSRVQDREHRKRNQLTEQEQAVPPTHPPRCIIQTEFSHPSLRLQRMKRPSFAHHPITALLNRLRSSRVQYHPCHGFLSGIRTDPADKMRMTAQTLKKLVVYPQTLFCILIPVPHVHFLRIADILDLCPKGLPHTYREIDRPDRNTVRCRLLQSLHHPEQSDQPRFLVCLPWIYRIISCIFVREGR